MVLITVDTLRPDHLGLYGYARSTSPELDRWFGAGAIFERAYSSEASTPPSVVSILSGQLPQNHGVRLFYQPLPEQTVLVSERLPDAYQRAAFVSNWVLTEESIAMADRFDHYDDALERRESKRPIYERPARDTTRAVLDWMQTSYDPSRPLFLWVHYIDPHGPYRTPAPPPVSFEHRGSQTLEEVRVPDYQKLAGVDDALAYIDRYDEEIAYSDAEIGVLLEALSGRIDAARALWIFTADHGESLLERERWFEHGYQVYEEIVRVPLLLRGPGVRSGRHAGPVSGIDIAPTILSFTGAPTPSEMRGWDLRRGNPPAGRPVFVEASDQHQQWRAVIEDQRKWVARMAQGNRIPRGGRFFDLASDPGEKNPLPWPPDESTATRLRELIRKDPDPGGLPRGGAAPTGPKVAPRADEEALKRLRALGYAE